MWGIEGPERPGSGPLPPSDAFTMNDRFEPNPFQRYDMFRGRL